MLAMLAEHMAACELSPFTNRWSEVHNFTPESSRFTITVDPSPESVGREIHVKIDQAIGIEGLKLSNADSYFFVTLPEKQLEHPEVGVLHQSSILRLKSTTMKRFRNAFSSL